MRKAAFIGESENEVVGLIKRLGDAEVYLSDNADIPLDCGCAVISQEFTGEEIGDMISVLKSRSIPVGVVTMDDSAENQKRLCVLGADDVIVLPIYEKLLRKRILALFDHAEIVDLSYFDNIAIANNEQGAFIVHENEFANIYRFVLRILERIDKKAQLVSFSLMSRFGTIVEPEIMSDFVAVVHRCLRKGDISSQHGNKLFVILLGSDESGARIVAKRLIETFWSVCDDDAYDIDFEIRDIAAKK